MRYLLMLSAVLSGTLFAQNAPEKTFSENISGTALANEVAQTANTNSGGDLNLSVPLVTVQSRTLTFPIELVYTSGITVDQQSGPVGLGWVMPIGSIVRDFGAFEPDYTSTGSEVGALNQNGGNDGWLQYAGSNVNINPSVNNQNLGYEITSDLGEDGGSIPDEYHVSVPGFFSNTFFNGSTTSTHEWIFQNDIPYLVDFSVKNFVISQEFSRINEANLGATNMDNYEDKEHFTKTGSYAAAITVPPYAENAYVWQPSAGSTSFNPTGDDLLVKYDDFESFTITDDNGNKFVFGRALRAQKYLVSEDPYWSTINYDAEGFNTSNSCEGNFWKIDYIAEWLLTEIHSPDYVDFNENGIADEGDLGDWIRFEYTDPVKMEANYLLGAGNAPVMQEVPAHREWSSFSQTDRASSLMIERAYLTKIVTPTQEIDFTISERYDVDHDYFEKPVNRVSDEFFYEDRKFSSTGSSSDFDISYPVETMRYDEIEVIDRSKDYTLYATDSPTLAKIKLNYAEKGSAEELAVSNYLIRSNDDTDRGIDPPSEGIDADIVDYYAEEGRGKTTLVGVTFYSSDPSEDDKQEYSFEYENNPSYSEVHKREIVRKKMFPSLRQSNWEGTTLFDPVALNNISYFTEDAPSITLSVSPYEFLIDVPYQEYYEKVYISSSADRAEYLVSDEADLPTGATVSQEYITHLLYPVKNVYNFAILPNGDQDVTAWSLTKVVYPTGGTIEFEYESDEFVLTEDESNWTISSTNLPLISEYNELARIRSRYQSVADTLDNGAATRNKKSTACFKILLPENGCGVRLKTETIDDGINTPVIINYEYGDGHCTGLPASFVQNSYSVFNSFIARERNRHNLEKLYYHSNYVTYLPEWTTDYEMKMRYYAFTDVSIDKAQSSHYYETISKVYPNGAISRRTYDFLFEGATLLGYDVHKVLFSRHIESNNRAKFIYASDYNPLLVDLVKVETFEAGNSQAIEAKVYEYEIDDLITFNLSSSTFPASETYGDYFEVWVSIGTDGTEVDSYDYDILLTSVGLETAIGAVVINDNDADFYTPFWSNIDGTDYGSTLVNLYPVNFYYEIEIDAQVLNKWGTSRKQLQQETAYNRGQEIERTYTYESLHGYPETITSSEVGGDVTITKIEYGFQTYSGITTLFETSNMLNQSARKTIFLNTIDNANTLDATFTTWDYSGTYPKPQHSYIYNTTSVDHVTGKFTHTPYSVTGTNASEWQLVEQEVISYDTDGKPVLMRQNEIFTKTISGYNRGIGKAVISSIIGEFDGTYTGFEDLQVPVNVPISSLPYPEYWYYQDLQSGEKTIDADIHASATNSCGNSLEIISSGYPNVYLSVVIESNVDINGQVFFVGDEVSVNGVDGTSTPLPELTSTVTDIQTLTSGKVLICLADPLPDEYEDVYWTSTSSDFPGEYTISKVAVYSNSGASKTYSRTGSYSYKLTGKGSSGDPARKTPVRPVIPPINDLIDYPSECLVSDMEDPERGVYSSECYLNYEASVWVKYDYNIRRETQAASQLAIQPYTTGANGGFVTNKPQSTSEDFNNTYLRGTTSATMDVYDVKLVYKLWNSARTVLIEEGEFYLEDLSNHWKQYTVEIPLFRGAENQQLDVYVESNIVDNNSATKKKSIYVDDLVVYPQGAEYSYISADKFSNATHSTNNNDVFVSQSSDEWGRISKVWNAYGLQVQSNDYVVSSDPLVDNSSTVTTWTASDKYYKTRVYTDGFNKEKQVVISDPSSNKRIVSSTTEYDDMGRPIRVYKSYSLNGSNLSSGHDPAYITKTTNLYESSYAFSEVQYFETTRQLPERIVRPRENVESEIAYLTSIYENTTTIGGSLGVPSYVAGKLVIIENEDAEGFISRTYYDDLGRTVLQEREAGFEYDDNTDGSISFTTTAIPFQQTWFCYDKAGRLIKSIDPSGKITEYFYNSMGQLIKSIEPDRGIREMRYNRFGQVRFEQSSKDADVANSTGYIDQFKYVKYDKWGRIIATGVMREMSDQNITNALSEVYLASDKFNNLSLIEDQNYPEAGKMFNQVNFEYTYDGTRANFDSRSLLKETVHSNHTINSNYQFIPAQTDETGYAYLLDGLMKSVSYNFHELSDPHVFNFEYTRFGEILKKTYVSPIDPINNYTWEYKYDNFGRPVEYLSGNENDFVSNGTNYYDALGNLYKLGIGKATDPLNPHIDYVVSRWDIRDRLIVQMSDNFRFSLGYNKNEQISDQYWSSEYFDPTSGSSINLNHYKYYYDASNRLIGADYKTMAFTSNPFAYFEGLAPTENNEFDCTYNTATAVSSFEELVDEIQNPGGGIVLGEAQKLRALAGLSFVKDEYLKSGMDWSRLSNAEKDAFLEDLIQKAGPANIDLKAYEEIKARIENDRDHLTDLQAGEQTTQTEWKITGKSTVGAVRTYGTLTPGKMKYTKAALNAMIYSLMKCETNLDATVYGFLPDFDISGAETNVSKYDAAYWYHANGNTSLLNRKDNAGVVTSQTYNYSNSTNNLLTSVVWNNGSATTTTYSYDLLGNLTFDEQNDNTISYDFFSNLPIGISNTATGTVNYRYSSRGVRTVKTIDGYTEYYLDEIILDENETVKSYQTVNGYATPSGDGNIDFYYVIKDWLGTARLTIDEQGDISSSRDHYPYGKIMPGRAFETDVEGKRYQFTGHEFDHEVNYEYHGARYYNRDLGRYLSVDPLAAKYLGWSTSVYAMNNPLNFVDPTGMAATDDYKLGRNGRLEMIRKTDDNFDVVFATNEDGTINKEKSITVEKGFLTSTSDKISYKVDGLYTTENSSEALKVFHFFSENTTVEWGLDKVGFTDNESTIFVITTSYNEWNNRVQSEFIKQWMASSVSHLLLFNIHSHPGEYDSKSGNPAFPSGFANYGEAVDESGDRSYVAGLIKRYGHRVPKEYYIYVPSLKRYVRYDPEGFINRGVRLPSLDE